MSQTVLGKHRPETAVAREQSETGRHNVDGGEGAGLAVDRNGQGSRAEGSVVRKAANHSQGSRRSDHLDGSARLNLKGDDGGVNGREWPSLKDHFHVDQGARGDGGVRGRAETMARSIGNADVRLLGRERL